jgi:hypothetical protein
MTLQSSGSISLGQVNTELGRSATATISLGESAVRTLAGIASGTISLSDLYGKSNIPALGLKGYWAGGDDASAASAAIDGIQFSNEASYNPSVTLADGARRNSGATYSGIRGYSMGAATGKDTVVDGMTFSSETAYNPSATLSPAVWSGTVNSYTTAYAGSSTGSASVAALTFATDTAYTPSATFSAYADFGGVSNNSSGKGYWAGGESGTKTVAYYNTFRGILFSNDTALSVSTTLAESSRSRINNSGAQQHNTYGLFFGGFSTSGLSGIDGINLSNETSYNPSATLSDIRWYVSSPNSGDKAYPGGGLYATSGLYNGIQTYTFSSATTGSLGYAMADGTRWNAGKYSYGGNNIY